jgi:hypothetical protein
MDGYGETHDIKFAVDEPQKRLFDDIVPWFVLFDHWKGHKSENVSVINKYVSDGDKVVVIGGGVGITSVAAAMKAGQDGHVIIYEGSDQRTEIIENTFRLNKIDTDYDIEHSIVATAKQIAGKMRDPKHISPTELPGCDVLEMDCEGAELAILSELLISPRAIIVETHPVNDSPTAAVIDELIKLGYTIVEKTPDPNSGHILFAEHTGGHSESGDQDN